MKMFSSLYLVLASMSRYRAQCLEKTTLKFQAIAPHIDESPLESEQPEAMVLRLAQEKAEKIHSSGECPEQATHIIASDQTLVCGGEMLGKPNTFEKAKIQLAKMSGQQLAFYTSLNLLNRETGRSHSGIVTTSVQMRKLSEDTIINYLNHEQPFDCAGSFKSETSGILLCKSMSVEDPNALIGLPLTLLMDFLEEEGYQAFV